MGLGLLSLLALAKRGRSLPAVGVALKRLVVNLQCTLTASPSGPAHRLLLHDKFLQRRRINRLRRNIVLAKNVRRWWVRPIFQNHATDGAWFKLIPLMREKDTDEFYNYFRMNAKSFDYLLELVTPHIQKKDTFWRKAVCPGERLAITLRYFACGDSFKSLSYAFLVSDQLISKIVFEVSTVIWEVLKLIVFEPITEEMWLRLAAEYEVMWHIPHCGGAIDGKHCIIKAPPFSGSRYYNYKQTFSLILMGVADAKRKFVMVDVGASGRRGDGNVFHTSAFKKLMDQSSLHLPPPCPFEGMEGNLPFVIIGDGAFERSHNLLNPFRMKKGILGAPERVFNTRFSGARHCIEDAFGLLYQRYEVFKKPMEVTKTHARRIILACTALHNYHLRDEESVPPKWRREYPQFYSHKVCEDGRILHGRYKNENLPEERRALQRLRHNVAKVESQEDDQLVGEDIREALLDYFIANPVLHQLEKAHVI